MTYNKKGDYNLLNLACGAKISSIGNWVNIDFSSPLKNVVQMNVLKGIRFPSMSFDVVYSAQFIEHLTLSQAEFVLKEVKRILKGNGILRIVTPDLEEIVQSYLYYLDLVKTGNNAIDTKKYDWIRIELFDQIVRDQTGGEMLTFIAKCDEQMQSYLSDRLDYSFKSLSATELEEEDTTFFNNLGKLKKASSLLRKLLLLFDSNLVKIGRFRTSGEVHRYIHDYYSLSRILSASGFSAVTRVDPYTSSILNWEIYGLDVINKMVDGPKCLYVEARKC